MRRDDERLQDILEAIESAGRFASGRSRKDLDADELLTAGLVHMIVVIGEAAAAVSERTKSGLPDLPWRGMMGMRNVVVHAYWRVDLDALWRTVEHDLPELAAGVRRALRRPGED